MSACAAARNDGHDGDMRERHPCLCSGVVDLLSSTSFSVCRGMADQGSAWTFAPTAAAARTRQDTRKKGPRQNSRGAPPLATASICLSRARGHCVGARFHRPHQSKRHQPRRLAFTLLTDRFHALTRALSPLSLSLSLSRVRCCLTRTPFFLAARAQRKRHAHIDTL
nr:hypothetical protein [Pandoravirus belohorizontensis]